MASASFIVVTPERIELRGAWNTASLAVIAAEMERQTAAPSEAGIVRADGITALDTNGALLLRRLLRALPQAKVEGLTAPHQALLQLLSETSEPEAPPMPAKAAAPLTEWVTEVGRRAVAAGEQAARLVEFTGQAAVMLARGLARPSRLRPGLVARQVRDCGVHALPLVAMIAFMISIVLAYQGASQLRPFGAEIFTVDLVVVSLLREMGVLLTAVIIAGRSGSAFAAEIGVMKVNEETDALRTMGLDPFEMLVMPRLVAMMIALPLLTFAADISGLLGGALASLKLLGLSPEQYLEQLQRAAQPRHFVVGMVKAPVFAFLIAVTGCMRGLEVRGSAESVGRMTTVAVVQSIFLVLAADALFSILFTWMDI